MCSSPRGSSTRRRHIKKNAFTRLKYEEYSSMMRRASAVYDKIEQEKAKRRQFIASQQPVITKKQNNVSKDEDKNQSNVFSGIKLFFRRQPI